MLRSSAGLDLNAVQTSGTPRSILVGRVVDHERGFVLEASEVSAHETLRQRKEGLAQLFPRLELAKGVTQNSTC